MGSSFTRPIYDKPAVMMGFADRALLSRNANLIRPVTGDLNMLSALRENRILHPRRFERALASVGEENFSFDSFKFTPAMFSRTVTPEMLHGTGIQELMSPELFAGRNMAAESLRQVTSQGLSGASYAVSKGKQYAYGGLNLLLLGTAAAATAGAVYNHPIAATLMGLTALSAAALNVRDKLPPGSTEQTVANAASKALPVLAAADAIGLSKIFYDANASISNMATYFSGTGTLGYSDGYIALLATMAYITSRYVGNNLTQLEKAYTAKLNPGTLGREKTQMALSTGSAMSDLAYFGVRTGLLTVALSYLLKNVYMDPNLLKAVSLSLPIVGTMASIGLSKFENVERFLRRCGLSQGWIDHFRCYLPIYGAAAGLIGTGILAATGQSWLLPIAYGTFWGSVSSYFLQELHGIFHSVNSNLGFQAALKTSSKDIMGTIAAQRLAGNAKVLIMNPHTGTNEHTYGMMFSTFLSRKPGLSFFVNCDRILDEINPGKNPGETDPFRRTNAIQDREYIAWVEDIQRNQIFQRLLSGINSLESVGTRYEQLAENLEGLADYFSTGLKDEIRGRMTNPATRGWFENDVEEFSRGCFQELDLRANEFREIAGRLRRKVESGLISEEDLYREWDWQLGCYDPDYMTHTPIARKQIAGDEREVRKVENVATVPLFRGLTVYKSWYTEFEGQVSPTEEWISGSWTRVRNPRFNYAAAPGTLEGSKYVWIQRQNVLTPLQESHQSCLSNSCYIEYVDNNPEGQSGFERGGVPIEVNINDRPTQISNYYFVSDSDQTINPRITSLHLRNGRDVSPAHLRKGNSLATFSRTVPAQVSPEVFTVSDFDFQLMMDKNDVELTSYSELPAILEREFQRTFVDIIWRYPYGRDIEIQNPRPGEEGQRIKDISIVDANFQLSFEGTNQIIPYKLDRSAAFVGPVTLKDIGGDGAWKNLVGAEVTRSGGRTTGFALVYRLSGEETRRVELPQTRWPRYIDSLGLPADDDGKPIELTTNIFTRPEDPQREGDMPFVKITYEDGKVLFARTPRRPHLLKVGEM